VRAAVAFAIVLLSAFAVTAPGVRAQPVAPAAQRAAFYADVRERRYEAAIAIGGAYRRAHPADERFGLDYAYALLAAHRTPEAEIVLRHLSNARLAAVRSAARRQLAAQASPRAAAAAAGVAAVPVAAPTPSPFTNAYELLAGGDLGAARDAFVATLATHPGDAAAWRQLSYIDFVLADRPAQIDALQHYTALVPDDDRAKLELAYAHLGQGDRALANRELHQLATSTTPEVAAAARRQLAAGVGSGGKPTRVDVFGYAENDSRFHDTFYGLDARYMLAPTKIEPYLAFHLANDAKSSSIPATTILNDNVAILSLGVRTKIAPIVYAFAEGGDAQSLLSGQTETDLRVGVLLSTRLGAGGFKPQTQIDASLTHYSRYVDNIAYANIAHDFFIGSKVVRGVVGTNLALDTSRAFYNNAVEGFGGLQVRHGNVTFRLVGVAGTYLGRGIDAPNRWYTSIRPILLVGFSH
jgi:hypothetical protein